MPGPMKQPDIRCMEMIRRREKAGFSHVNRSFLADKVARVPSLEELAELPSRGWWQCPSVITSFTNAHNGLRPSVATRLRIVYDDDHLFAAFHMEEPQMAETCAAITEPGTRRLAVADPTSGRKMLDYVIEKDDSVQLCLDFDHGSGRYVLFLVNIAGVSYADETESHYGEAIYPHLKYIEPWDKDYRAAACKGKDYWCAALAVPFSSIGAKPARGQVFGIDASRSRTVTEWHHHCLCGGPNLGKNRSAVAFGDLYLGDMPIALERTDFGHPVLAENSLAARIANTSGKELSLVCTGKLTVDSTGQVMSEDSAEVTLPPDGSGSVRLNYRLDWQELGRQTLELTIADKDSGRHLLKTRYFFGYKGQIPAEQPHAFDAPRPNPDPNDEDFIEKKRDYILSRLPHFHRCTTNDGAASDFTLRSDCGNYEFNLMKSGVLRQIAGMVESIFPDRNDRLIAACLLAHQKSFSMHMAPHVSLHRQITPLSALRLNGGHCYSRALVWLGIVRNLEAGENGQVYGDRAHALLVLGHVLGAVDVGDDDRIVFDPSVGAFFYRWDNKNFATERELEADPSLSARMHRNRERFFANVRYHRAVPAGQIVFPQGAPGE